jgi:Spy/CpxP family protein refolding chaperone
MNNKIDRQRLQAGCDKESINRRIIIGASALLALTADSVSAAWEEPDANSGPAGPEWKEGQSPADKGPRQMKREHKEQGFAHIAQALGLNDPQQRKIEQILQAEWDKSAPLRQELKANWKHLRRVEQAEMFDEAAVHTITMRQAQLVSEMIVARTLARNQIHSLLTPKQCTIAEELWPPCKFVDQGGSNHPWTGVVRGIFVHLWRKVDMGALPLCDRK